jgi:hypothetical protein
MMVFAIIIFLGANADQVQLKISSPTMLSFGVEFSEFKKNEQQPITRFIMSETPPIYEYIEAELDSSSDSPGYDDSEPVRIGTPVILENVTLYPIQIEPSYIRNRIKYFIKSADIKVYFTHPAANLQLSPSMSAVYRELILNFEAAGDGKPLGYLIIAPSAYVDEIQPLAQWKEKKGWDVEIRTTAQTGTTPAQIKEYIATAYNTWSPRPEYVLLVGDVTGAYIIPPAANALPVSYTDYPYTLIEGDDFLAELLIGRLPAASELEVSTMVAKIIGYECTPYMNETSWFTRALMVAANYPGFMTTPIPTKRWIRDRLFENGFTNVDTVYYPPTASGEPISNSVNQGVIFVNYRAGDADNGQWIFPQFTRDDVIALENGWRLPVVTSITCLTGNFLATSCLGETWLRAGNPVTPKGAVAFIGASAASTSSRWNNCLDYGIYWAILQENIFSLGPAFYRGKMEVYGNFPDDTTWSQGSSFYFHTYNLLGDPSLSVWTDVPDTFQVTHSSSMPVGANFLSTTVTNSASQAVEGAMVSLYKNGEVKEVSFTDASGYADFNFATTTQDTLFVTVTKHNYKPYQGFALVNNSTVYVDHFSHTVNDPGGNNNGEVNPGETIQLAVTLKNYGSSTTATNVSALLSTDNPNVTISDSVNSYGNISPGSTATASPFVFNVSTSAQHNDLLKFTLIVTSDEGTWSGALWILVKDAHLVYQWNQVLDANGILEPGETHDFLVSISNIGGLEGMNVWGTLGSHNSGLTVTDSIGYFGDIAVGDSANNSSNHFTISADVQLTPGTIVRFSLIMTGDNGLVDTTGFRLRVGIVDSSAPLGPDDYGYYAYDDTDVGYTEKPDYNWVEIDPNHGGPGDSLILGNDETTTMSLPFSFKYYGDWYSQISICSNGYIALGATSNADMYNWAIPAAGGPPLLIAPFWDDLHPEFTDSSGNVSYWHDATNHCFVVEWSRIQHVHDPTNPTPGELQTFEVTLYDPQYYPTQTDDGEILFQYLDITNDDVWHNYATVGIEDYEHTTGLEYTFANSYPDAAAPLANNRAIKFTTDPPDTFTGIKELNSDITPCSWLLISPNPFNRTTNIRYMIHDLGYIEELRNSDFEMRKPSIRIYDATGRLVKSFYLESRIENHESSFLWDGTDNIGKKVPEGVYFVRLQGSQFNITEKVVFVE